MDPYLKVIYCGFLNDKRYKHVEKVIDDPLGFIKFTQEKWQYLCDNQDVGDTKANANIRKLAENIKDCKFELRPFDTEQELIEDFFHYAFQICKPDILGAFNAGFDFGTLYEEGKNIGIDPTKWNIPNMPMYTHEPIIDTSRDHIDPVMRTIVLQNFSVTKLVCFQEIFYKLRNMNQYRSKSLDTTANLVAGFGKLDYSQYSNSVITLPYKNMWIHLAYACVDSMLLPLLEAISDDLRVFYTIINMCKIPFNDIAVSNSKIPNRFNNEAFRRGKVAAVNVNKILRYKSYNEVVEIQTKLNLQMDLVAIWRELNINETINGGLCSNPNLAMPPSVYNPFIADEVFLANFRKMWFINYNDAKSQYPSAYISGNINATTQVGQARAILTEDNKGVIVTKWNLLKEFGGKYKPHLGDLTLAIVNQNVSKIGNLLFSLPEYDEVMKEFISADGEKMKIYPYIQDTIKMKTSKRKEFISLLRAINSYKSNNDSNSVKKRNKFSFYTYEEHRGGFVNNASNFFIGKEGDIFSESYMGSYLQWEFVKGNLQDYFEIPYKYRGRNVYGTFVKDSIVLDESLIYKTRNTPNFNEKYDYTGEIKIEDLERLNKDSIFTEELHLVPGLTPMHIVRRQIAYPVRNYLRDIKKDQSKLKVHISPLLYSVKIGDQTYRVKFEYTISMDDPEIVIKITQYMNLLKFKENKKLTEEDIKETVTNTVAQIEFLDEDEVSDDEEELVS